MRQYKAFNYSAGYPGGKNLFYECAICGEAIPSRPEISVHCKCRNIMIDVDYGRTKIRDHSKVKIFCEGT